MRTISYVIVGVFSLIIGGAGGFYFEKSSIAKKTSEEPSVPTNSLQTYTNKSLNFSLQYPESWIKEQPKILNNNDILATMEFSDPTRSKELEISDCLINESFNWANNTPVKEDCTNILSKVTEAQRKELNVKIYPRNIYISVIQPKEEVGDLKSWLTNRFKSKDGGLADFKPGEEIALGNAKGYIAEIGCCANYDVSYFVQKDNLIYQLGTNYGDGNFSNGQNSLLNEIGQNFKFL